jgi:hypothetical protein
MLDAARWGEGTPTGPDRDHNKERRSMTITVTAVDTRPAVDDRPAVEFMPYDLRGVQTRDLTLRPVIVRLNTSDCSVEVVMGGRAALKFAEDLITEVRRPIRHD